MRITFPACHILLLPLVGCAVHHPDRASQALQPPEESSHRLRPAGLSPPFSAEYLGSEMGLGFGCDMLDPPPFGAWTVVVRVADPRDSGLPAGKQLCAVVHSPSLYQSGRSFQQCVWQVGSEPPLWACGEDADPSGLRVFTEADAAALDAKEAAVSVEHRATLKAQLDALQGDARSCPGLSADAVEEVSFYAEQLGPIADASDFDEAIFQDAELFARDARANLDAALTAARCLPRASLEAQRDRVQRDVQNCPALPAEAASAASLLVEVLQLLMENTTFNADDFRLVGDGLNRLHRALAAAGCDDS